MLLGFICELRFTGAFAILSIYYTLSAWGHASITVVVLFTVINIDTTVGGLL